MKRLKNDDGHGSVFFEDGSMQAAEFLALSAIFTGELFTGNPNC